MVDIQFPTAENRQGKIEEEERKNKLECGPMPSVMATLPNIGGALCSTPQSLADTTGVPCSTGNAAKTQNLLKLAGVPQTTGPISTASGPKFTMLWRHMEEILLRNKFFFQLSVHALIAKI